MTWKSKTKKEKTQAPQKKIPVKSPQTLHTMRFSITKLFWAISCISSFSAKAFFRARKDMIILKSISNSAFPSVFRHHIGQRLATLFPSLLMHIPEETLKGSITAFCFFDPCQYNLPAMKVEALFCYLWSLSSQWTPCLSLTKVHYSQKILIRSISAALSSSPSLVTSSGEPNNIKSVQWVSSKSVSLNLNWRALH